MGSLPLVPAQMLIWGEYMRPILSHQECKSNETPIGRMYSPQINICAGTKGRDTCQGDSGGPLVVNVNERFVLLGVTSWGIECGAEGKPGLYTKVSSFIDWINLF